MARYTCSYLVKVSLEEIQPLISNILQSCHFEVIYQSLDYMMAKEIPGEVNFSKLSGVEVLIDNTTAKENEITVTLVVKSDELPLQVKNHCHQKYDQVQEAINKDYREQFIESVIKEF